MSRLVSYVVWSRGSPSGRHDRCDAGSAVSCVVGMGVVESVTLNAKLLSTGGAVDIHQGNATDPTGPCVRVQKHNIKDAGVKAKINPKTEMSFQTMSQHVIFVNHYFML